MVATWNTGEASQLYEQNFVPTARGTVQPKERMLDDMCDILLPTTIDYVSDLIIVCTQETPATKKEYCFENLFAFFEYLFFIIEPIGKFYYKKLLVQFMFYFIQLILVLYHYAYFYEET